MSRDELLAEYKVVNYCKYDIEIKTSMFGCACRYYKDMLNHDEVPKNNTEAKKLVMTFSTNNGIYDVIVYKHTSIENLNMKKELMYSFQVVI